MSKQPAWSVSIGRWSGICVRVHLFFFLFAAFTFYLGWQANREFGGTSYTGMAILSLTILAGSVLLHVLAHCHMALRLGVNVNQILLGPVGELSPIRRVDNSAQELAITSAGPVANAFISLCCLPGLIFVLRGDQAQWIGLLLPFQPTGVYEGILLTRLLKLVFWINWLLFLSNVIPAFPLDGGRILRALLLLLIPEVRVSVATRRVARVAQAVAFGMVVVACVFRESEPPGSTSTWFAFVILGICLFFAAQHEVDQSTEDDAEEDLVAYDFSKDFSSQDERVEPTATVQTGMITRWLTKRRELREQKQCYQETDDERRVDEVLARLHEGGMSSLSAADRRLLSRVSERYRNRRDP